MVLILIVIADLYGTFIVVIDQALYNLLCLRITTKQLKTLNDGTLI